MIFLNKEMLTQYNDKSLIESFTGRCCWVGPDVLLFEAATLAPHTVAALPIEIEPNNLPPVEECSPSALELFRWSVRSRYAQLGIDIHSVRFSENDWLAFKVGKQNLSATVYAENLSLRPVEIPEQTALFRFFSGSQITKRFEGRTLKELVSGGTIHIGDNTDIDWLYAPGQLKEDANIIGIKAPLDPDWRKIMPMDTKPVSVDPNAANYRKLIHDQLVDAPETSGAMLWLGRTPHVTLPPGIAGIISEHTITPDITTFAAHRGNVYVSEPSRHISSRYIDPCSDWRLIVEINGSTDPSLRATHVAMYFVPALCI